MELSASYSTLLRVLNHNAYPFSLPLVVSNISARSASFNAIGSAIIIVCSDLLDRSLFGARMLLNISKREGKQSYNGFDENWRLQCKCRSDDDFMGKALEGELKGRRHTTEA